MKPKDKQHHYKHKKPSKKGLPPGSTVYTGKNIVDVPLIEVMSLSCVNPVKWEISIDEIGSLINSGDYYWINIFGVSNSDYVKRICDAFNIHILYQEDIMNVYQRPKLDEENEYIILTFKSLDWVNESQYIDEEQLTFVLTKKILITFQEKLGDNFDDLRLKNLTPTNPLKDKQHDYFFYRLLDITVDGYFELVERIGNDLDSLENEVLLHNNSTQMSLIQKNKSEIIQLRRHIYPLRDVISRLVNIDHPFIHSKTIKYFRDVQDHVIQLVETLDVYREMNNSCKEIYLNTISHEMNRVMKVLTILSSLFIPLTFIVGVYGMNFDVIPELHNPNGYYITWTVMLIIVIVQLVWFKFKKWM